MNRRQRREIEKKMGITKHKKSLSRAKQFEMIALNIAEGKKRQSEMKETVRTQDQVVKDNNDSNKVSSLATTLMIKEGLSYIDALSKAKEQLEQTSN